LLLEANSEVDLAVVDLAMPGMRGAASIRELRHTYPQLQCVVMSGSEQRQDVLDALAAGAIGYIPKSLDPEAMVAAIQQVLGGGIYAPTLLLTEPSDTAEPSPTVDPNVMAMLTPRQYDVLRLRARSTSPRAR
jgi:DNA-binding NarL/FixJ family response regulator